MLRGVRPERGFDVQWQNSIGYLLRDTTRLLLRIAAAKVAPYGITLTQYFMLRQLWEEDGPSQRDLARRLDVPQSALAILLDELEREGLLERRRSTSDRRKTHVHLTPRAKKLRAPLLEHGAALIDEMLADVSDRSVADLRRTLRRMKTNLERLAGRP